MRDEERGLHGAAPSVAGRFLIFRHLKRPIVSQMSTYHVLRRRHRKDTEQGTNHTLVTQQEAHRFTLNQSLVSRVWLATMRSAT
jgi:hypothetical protein